MDGLPPLSPEEKIHLFARLGDMELANYRNTLALVTIIELLAENGLITREEVASRAQLLEADLDGELAGAVPRRPDPQRARPRRPHPGNSPGAAESGSSPSTTSR